MSAPTTERTRASRTGAAGAKAARATAARSAARSATRTATIPAQRGAPSVERGGATSRAYARRDDRLRKLVGGRTPKNAPPAGRAKFVLLVMGLLAGGLVVTLWLSTAAAADSYRLQDARVAARALSEQSEQLRREVTAMDAAPALAQRAATLGMVPVQDSARLVVAPDGTVTVAGTPKAAIATVPPAPPAPAVVPNDATATDAAPNDAAPTTAPNGTDPNTPTADAAAAAGAPISTTAGAAAAGAPIGTASSPTTGTPRAGATSAPATPTAAASRSASPSATATNAARSAAASAAVTAAPKTTPKPTAAARPSGPAAGTR